MRDVVILIQWVILVGTNGNSMLDVHLLKLFELVNCRPLPPWNCYLFRVKKPLGLKTLKQFVRLLG